MPQVISLVRGTATISTANGSNAVSLFTNSGAGIATRVIVNQVTVTSGATSVANFGTGVSIYNNGSGTAESLIGAVYTLGSAQRVSITPSQSVVGGVAGANTSGIYVNGGTLVASRDGFNTIALNAQSYNICPTTFWIGPSDNIRAKAIWYASSGKANVPQSVTIAYSFTLITET